jgi:hypothetical protein
MYWLKIKDPVFLHPPVSLITEVSGRRKNSYFDNTLLERASIIKLIKELNKSL